MRTKTLTSLFAIALAFIACNKNVPEPEPVFTPELKLDKTEKIAMPAEGGSVNLKVTANISWTAAVSNQNVATVSPAAKEITDKKSAETAVTVTVKPNEDLQARTATLTFKAEGCQDIVVNIEQAAAEVETVFEVFDNQGNPITEDIEISGAGGQTGVYVNANVSWTATSSADWLTATPASFEATSTEAEPTAVTILAAINPTTESRTATITFSATDVDDIVVTVNQGFANTLEIEVDDITYRGAYVFVTPSDETGTYYSVLMTKELYDDLLGQGATDDLIPAFFAEANAENYEMTIQEFLGYVLKSGEDYYEYTDLDPETDFVFLTQYMDIDGNPLSAAFKATFTTPAKPAVDPDYSAFLGTWKFNHDKYEYDSGKGGFVKAGKGSWTAVIEESLVNEELYISFPVKSDKVSPIDGEYYDRFPVWFQKEGDATMALLPFGYYGDLRFFWGFQGVEEYCAMAFVGYYQDMETEEMPEGVIFVWGDDTTLVPVYPEDPYVMTTGVFTEEEYQGYYSGYVCPTSVVKVSSNSSSALKASARTADKRLDIKATSHAKKAGKVNKVKGLSYKKAPSYKNYVELPR